MIKNGTDPSIASGTITLYDSKSNFLYSASISNGVADFTNQRSFKAGEQIIVKIVSGSAYGWYKITMPNTDRYSSGPISISYDDTKQTPVFYINIVMKVPPSTLTETLQDEAHNTIANSTGEFNFTTAGVSQETFTLYVDNDQYGYGFEKALTDYLTSRTLKAYLIVKVASDNVGVIDLNEVRHSGTTHYYAKEVDLSLLDSYYNADGTKHTGKTTFDVTFDGSQLGAGTSATVTIWLVYMLDSSKLDKIDTSYVNAEVISYPIYTFTLKA